MSRPKKFESNAEYKKWWNEQNRQWIKEYKAEYYQQNKELKKTQTRELKEKNRQMLIERLGGECVDCGETKNLEFDHKHGEVKLFNVTKLMTSTRKVTAEADKCELRCKKCHRVKTNNELTLAYQLLKELSLEEYQRRISLLQSSDTTP